MTFAYSSEELCCISFISAKCQILDTLRDKINTRDRWQEYVLRPKHHKFGASA